MATAQVKDGQIVATRLPRHGVLSDGRTVSNYLALPDDTLYAEGWREVVDNGEPDHDPETQRVRRDLEVQGDEVHAVYTVEDQPPPEPRPDVATWLGALRQALGKQTIRQIGGSYPDAVQALETGAWDVAREGLDDAHADGVLSDEQHQQALDLAAQHNVPLAQ